MASDIRPHPGAHQAPGIEWRTSSYSGKQGNCVALGSLPGRTVVRDSKDPHGMVLSYARAGMAYFLNAVKDGMFEGRQH